MSGTDSYGKEGDKEMIKEAIAFIKEHNEQRNKLRKKLIESDTLNAKGWGLRIIYFLLDIPSAVFWLVAWIISGWANVLDAVASWITYLFFYFIIKNKDKEGENTDGDNTESN